MNMYILLSPWEVLPIFVLLILSLILLRKSKQRNVKLPPGRFGWPIIGETIEFGMSGRNGQPETFTMDRLKKYSPHQIFKTSLLSEKMAVFCGSSGNKFLFSNENKHVVSWWPRSITQVVIFQDSDSSAKKASFQDETNQMRTILPEFLRPESLQRYVPVMDSVVKKHLELEMRPNNQIKVFPLARKLAFYLACRLFLDIEDPDLVDKLSDNFAHVSDGILSVPIDFPGTAFHRANKAAKLLHRQLHQVIKNKRMCGTNGHNLLSILLSEDKNGKLMSDVEIANKVFSLLIAGHETTSTVIANVVYFLADHPHVYDQVLKEQKMIAKSKGAEKGLSWEDVHKMKYSRNVVNEVLRLAPPATGGFREAIHDFTYAGFLIPKGWKAHWTVNSTHRDPQYFPNPDKFDPSRFEGDGPKPFSFVPFGGGPRMCPGSEFAKQEVLIYLHNMVLNFKWQKVIPTEKIIFSPMPTPAHGLPITLQPHDQPLSL